MNNSDPGHRTPLIYTTIGPILHHLTNIRPIWIISEDLVYRLRGQGRARVRVGEFKRSHILPGPDVLCASLQNESSSAMPVCLFIRVSIYQSILHCTYFVWYSLTPLFLVPKSAGNRRRWRDWAGRTQHQVLSRRWSRCCSQCRTWPTTTQTSSSGTTVRYDLFLGVSFTHSPLRAWSAVAIGHYQNKCGPVSESMALGIVWDRIRRIRGKNAAAVQLLCTWLHNSHNCSVVAFLLGIFACLVPPNDPKYLCVADSDSVSHSFW